MIGALIAGLLLVPGSNAPAADPCLHRTDFRTVERSALDDWNPMARRRVHELFGTRGQPIGYHTRVYQGCGDGSQVWLQFTRDAGGIPRVMATAYTPRYFGDGDITLQPA